MMQIAFMHFKQGSASQFERGLQRQNKKRDSTSCWGHPPDFPITFHVVDSK